MNSFALSLALAAQAGALLAPSASSFLSSSSVPSGKDIAGTSVMEDLRTDSAFAETYETSYPKKASLSKDAFGNEESKWQAISLAPGIREWTETYLYFYHPLCDYPVWKSADGMTMTTDVLFRVTMALTGSLDSYGHHWLSLVSKSDDLRFWKFVMKEDLSSRMKDAEYRAFRISEFEVTDRKVTNSNAFSVSKTFAWTKQSDGAYKEVSQVLTTIELDPFDGYHRIAGKNGHDFSSETCSVPLDDTSCGDKSSVNSYYHRNWMGYDFSTYCALTDSFYVIFPLSPGYGKLCGADLEYDLCAHWGLYEGGTSAFENAFDQDSLAKIQSRDIIDKDSDKVVIDDPAVYEERRKVRLTTGLDSDFGGIQDMSPSVADEKFGAFTSWWKDRAAWNIGYADKYDLPTIQKLSPLSGSDFVNDSDYSRAATNPYAIDSKAEDYLSSAYDSGSFLSNDYYILRYDMEDFRLLDVKVDPGNDLAYFWKWAFHGHDVNDIDVMDLHFFKAGAFYTIGVVADSGHVVTGGELPSNPGSLFDWTWLVVAAVAVSLLLCVYGLARLFSALGRESR